MKHELKFKNLISESWLKEVGFQEKTEGWEYLIQQYGGYHDFIYYEFIRHRLVIQYKCNQVEIIECTKKSTMKRALSLVGYKLKGL